MSITRATIDAAIVDRIGSDPAFRAALLEDPRSALAALTGTEIPECIRITVHGESPADIHLVIRGDSPMSDADLELVAGGSWGFSSCDSGPGMNSCVL
jgi:hypothetical protein